MNFQKPTAAIRMAAQYQNIDGHVTWRDQRISENENAIDKNLGK